MPLQHAGPIGDSRLRCVFDDAVMSFSLGDHPTLGDIAEMLDTPAMRRHGAPVMIDLAMLAGAKPEAGFSIRAML